MSFTARDLIRLVCSDPSLKRVHLRYPFLVTDHIAGLMNHLDDPIARQFIPSELELLDDGGWEDPLGENDLSPVPGLVHRYPDRVLWIVTSKCAVRCRFCTRKRLWKHKILLSEEDVARTTDYIKKRNEIRDVLISGGDPLLIHEEILERILYSLRSIDHVVILRIGTRLPIADPEKVTPDKISLLARYQPLYVNIHVNHPGELSDSTCDVLERMASAGIPMGSQTVLLRGINDDAEVLGKLFLGLLRHRVRPYYLLQMDLMKGTAHFRTPVNKGLEIMGSLRHRISGLAIPHFVLDLPGGGGKVPLVPSCVKEISNGEILVRNRYGGISSYPLQHGEERILRKLITGDNFRGKD